jgi:hypothetical protein
MAGEGTGADRPARIRCGQPVHNFTPSVRNEQTGTRVRDYFGTFRDRRWPRQPFGPLRNRWGRFRAMGHLSIVEECPIGQEQPPRIDLLALGLDRNDPLTAASKTLVEIWKRALKSLNRSPCGW